MSRESSREIVRVSSDISSDYFDNHRVRHLSSDYADKIFDALMASTKAVIDRSPEMQQGGARILSIGCGAGEYDARCAAGLKGCRLQRYTGVEPDSGAGRTAAETAFGLAGQCEVDVWQGCFDSFCKQHGSTRKYDIIYIVHAIHMMDIARTIEGALRLLEPGKGLLHIAIQTREGVPELYERAFQKSWPFRTAEDVLELLRAGGTEHTVIPLDCFIDTSHDKVKQLCDFLFLTDTADMQQTLLPMIEGGVKEKHVVISVPAPNI